MSRKLKLSLLLLVLAVTVFFRFYKLNSIPPGLYPDIAMNGNNAVQALETHDFKAFYPENNGREGLFINLQALSIHLFGPTVLSLKLVSAILGVLTVLGVYFLASALFNTQIGLLSSFLMAINFWHVNFSRMGFRAIMAPLCLVWMLYFLYRGLTTTRFSHFIMAGVMLGLGFNTYIAFRGIPLAIVIILLAYWHFLSKDMKPDGTKKYKFVLEKMGLGILLASIATIIVSLPLAYYFYQNPADFLGRTAQVSIFSSANPIKDFVLNWIKTLGMFNFSGDWNWRHNFSGSPLLIWPVGIFFAAGFIRSFIKLFKLWKSHGHLSSVQVLLLSTFFVSLLPATVSDEGIPHALRAIIVAPIIFIMAGEGMWWFFTKLRQWYSLQDAHPREAKAVTIFALIIYLIAITTVEYDKYFNKWANNPNVQDAFNQNYVDMAKEINAMPIKTDKYIVVYARGVLVNGIPMPTQTVMYLTDSYTPEKQAAKNIHYLDPDQYKKIQYKILSDRNAVVIPLN